MMSSSTLRRRTLSARIAIGMFLLPLLITARASADWQTAHEATARVSTTGGTGSGACFAHHAGYAWFLTNAHVVGNARTAAVEVWKQGHPSEKISGLVAYRRMVDSASIDVAIVAVPLASFGAHPPPAIPLAESYSYPVGEELLSVGCPKAVQASAYPMSIAGLSQYGDRVFCRPGAFGGQSGSCVFTKDGDRIVALIAWTDNRNDPNYAIAQTLPTIFAAFQQAQANLLQTTETGWRSPGLCPRCGLSKSAGRLSGQPPGNTAQCQGPFCPRPQYQQQPQQQTPFPTLPPLTGTSSADAQRIAQLEQRMNDLEAKGAAIYSALQQVEAEWPRVRAAIDTSSSDVLRSAAAEVEAKYSELKSDLLKRQEVLADNMAQDLEEVAEENDTLRGKLREFAGDVVSLQNALDIANRVKTEREANPDLSLRDAVKDALRAELGDDIGGRLGKPEGEDWAAWEYLLAVGGSILMGVGVPAGIVALVSTVVRRKAGKPAENGGGPLDGVLGAIKLVKELKQKIND